MECSSDVTWLRIYDPDRDDDQTAQESHAGQSMPRTSQDFALQVDRVTPDPAMTSPCELTGGPAKSAAPNNGVACGEDEGPYHHERIIQVIQNEVETKRIAVVRVETGKDTFVLLQQQEWAAGIGWFTQRSIELESGQLGPLRCTLQLCGDCKSNSNKRKVAAAALGRGLGIVS